MVMIELKNLTKKYDEFLAVDHLNLQIETGEFFGLLGPNGAGKTTTVGMMSTLLLPTEGEVLIDGEQLTRQNARLKLYGNHTQLMGMYSARRCIVFLCG